jgi:class 3 adenylate cyclase
LKTGSGSYVGIFSIILLLQIIFLAVYILPGSQNEAGNEIIVALSMSFVYYSLFFSIFGYLFYKPIARYLRDGLNFSKMEARLKKLPTLTSWLVLITSAVWTYSMIYPNAIHDVDPHIVFKLYLIYLFFFVFIIFPTFLSYILTDLHVSRTMQLIQQKYDVIISPGKNSLVKTLFFLFLVISILPFLFSTIEIILYEIASLNIIEIQSDENKIVYSVINGIIIFISIIVFMYIITRQLKTSISSLLKIFSSVENGNLNVKAPVISNDEIGELTYRFNSMIDGLRDRDKIRKMFGHYVSGEIADFALKNSEALKGEERIATVLFTDIYDYTTIAESLTPPQTVEMLNEYYNLLVEIVQKHNGVVNKFIGDAVMVLFNIPIEDPRHASNAIVCAQKIVEKSEAHTFTNGIKLKTRAGINTGAVVAGNLGSTERYEYTVIGDSVNIAQRLENLNKNYGTSILFSESTLKAAGNSIDSEFIDTVQVKGKSESVSVYSVKSTGKMENTNGI